MRLLQTLVVVGAFTGFSSAGAYAATTYSNLGLAPGSSQTFSYVFSDSFSGRAVLSASRFLSYYDPVYEVGGFSHYETMMIDCFVTDFCTTREDQYLTPGYIKLSITPTINGFDILAESRVNNYYNCDHETRERQLCGESFGGSTLFVGIDTDGTYEVTVTSNPVPEPSTWAIMIAGFALLGITLRRRRTVLAS